MLFPQVRPLFIVEHWLASHSDFIWKKDFRMHLSIFLWKKSKVYRLVFRILLTGSVQDNKHSF